MCIRDRAAGVTLAAPITPDGAEARTVDGAFVVGTEGVLPTETRLAEALHALAAAAAGGVEVAELKSLAQAPPA